MRWLKADLAENRSRCTLAYFHHPLFGSGEYGPGVTEVKPLWEILYAAGGDVVLNSHDHNYQRFALQNPDGEASAERGIREFVVGTGGRSHYPIVAPIANSEVYNDDTYGVLRLTLPKAATIGGSSLWKVSPSWTLAAQAATDGAALDFLRASWNRAA